MDRTVLTGLAAKLFYTAAINYMDAFDDSFKGIGGYFYNRYRTWTAFDFTDGTEMFYEDFDDEVQAIKYASGIEAKTIRGEII